MRHILLTMTLFLFLTGCFSLQQISTYPDKGHDITTPKGTFTIRDKEDTQMLFIQPSIGTSFKMGTPPLPYAREAAQMYLAEIKPDCTLVEIYLFQAPFYEATYSCK